MSDARVDALNTKWCTMMDIVDTGLQHIAERRVVGDDDSRLTLV